jgi:hypothetical protein
LNALLPVATVYPYLLATSYFSLMQSYQQVPVNLTTIEVKISEYLGSPDSVCYFSSSV